MRRGSAPETWTTARALPTDGRFSTRFPAKAASMQHSALRDDDGRPANSSLRARIRLIVKKPRMTAVTLSLVVGACAAACGMHVYEQRFADQDSEHTGRRSACLWFRWTAFSISWHMRHRRAGQDGGVSRFVWHDQNAGQLDDAKTPSRRRSGKLSPDRAGNTVCWTDSW